jgi:octanoyl-[GcvH]:protein N-octanoyltransferase
VYEHPRRAEVALPGAFMGMNADSVALVRRSFPDRPALGVAVSRAILMRVAAGELPPTVRLHRPSRMLAFSRQDRASAGFPNAVMAAHERGFAPVLRLAGGRAAVYHEGTLACSWAVPDRSPPRRTTARFAELAELLVRALRPLGVDARIGEVPGEYCPGAWSVNARGRTKLAGIGQRLIAGAAHRGAVIVASGAERIRDVLVPIYEALDLAWNPATAGSVEDEIGEVALERVADAILSELSGLYEVVEGDVDDATLALAAELEHEHALAPDWRVVG